MTHYPKFKKKAEYLLCGSCIQPTKQFKVQIIGILEEIDSFIDLLKMWQKICAAPPPHLNKIQKQFFSQESVRYEFSEQESWAEKKNCTGEIWQWQWLLFSLSPLTFIWVAGQRAALVMFNKSNVSKTTLILNPSLSQTWPHWNISWSPSPSPL